jgi:predicted hydrolase (HD superfamily)
MDTLARSDIFFIVTTAVVILIGLAILAVLVRIYRILRVAKDIATMLKFETDNFRDSVARAKIRAKEKGLIGFFAEMLWGATLHGKRSSKKEKKD